MNKDLTKTLCTLLLIPMTFTGCRMALPQELKGDDSKSKDADLIISTPADENSGEYDENDYARVPDIPDEDPNLAIKITDLKGNSLAAIESSDSGMIVPGIGVFYKCDNEYRLTRMTEDGKPENIILGSANEYSYETFYARTYIGNELYTLAIKGNPEDNVKDQLYLLEFDLADGKKNEYLISDNGFPYASLTAYNGNILLFFHDQQDILTDRVIEFNTTTKEVREVLTYTLDNDLQGESVRSVYADKDNIYVLKAIYKGSKDISMAVDVFDGEYKIIKELNITDPMMKAINECAKEDGPNELIQAVSSFNIFDGRYLYYENFSVTRAFIDLTSSSLLCAIPDPFTSSVGNGPKVFYSIFCLESNDTVDPRSVYVFENGELKKIPTAIQDDGQLISSITASPDGYYMVSICDEENKPYMAKIVSSSELR